MTYSTSPTAINVIDIESSCTVAQDSNVGAYGRVLGKVIPTPRQLAVLKEMDDLQLFRLLGSGGYRETTCTMPLQATESGGDEELDSGRDHSGEGRHHRPY